MTQSHTATPWGILNHTVNDLYVIGTLGHPWVYCEERNDAAFIVKCVNEYEALKAKEKFWDEITTLRLDPLPKTYSELEKINAELVKALLHMKRMHSHPDQLVEEALAKAGAL